MSTRDLAPGFIALPAVLMASPTSSDARMVDALDQVSG
jgi:hypothetical protein